MGSSHGEKEPRKATYANADAIKDIRHRLSYLSRRSLLRLTARVWGSVRLNWLLLKERNNHHYGTNKNESRVCR
jgi:hypothetical protein